MLSVDRRNQFGIPGLLLVVLIGLTPRLSPGEGRVAFIAGNDAYPTVPLKNAVRDATAVREMLVGKLGFPEESTYFAANTDRIRFFEIFEEFARDAADADIVLFYYAGHGMESIDGRDNFILPIDADVKRASESEAALRATGVSVLNLSSEVAHVSQGAKIILIDACRERPANRAVAGRSGGGLATYEDAGFPADTLMMLAAAPERVASDGESHGPFTEALLEVLPLGGQDIMDTFFAVSDHVKAGTENRQVPWLKFDGSGQIFRQQHFLSAPGSVGLGKTQEPPGPGDAMAMNELRRQIEELQKALNSREESGKEMALLKAKIAEMENSLPSSGESSMPDRAQTGEPQVSTNPKVSVAGVEMEIRQVIQTSSNVTMNVTVRNTLDVPVSLYAGNTNPYTYFDFREDLSQYQLLEGHLLGNNGDRFRLLSISGMNLVDKTQDTTLLFKKQNYLIKLAPGGEAPLGIEFGARGTDQFTQDGSLRSVSGILETRIVSHGSRPAVSSTGFGFQNLDVTNRP